MKAKELRSMNEAELENKSIELKKELMKSNSQVAIGTVPKNPGKIKEMKKAIAKIITIRKEKSAKSSSHDNDLKNKGGSKKE